MKKSLISLALLCSASALPVLSATAAVPSYGVLVMDRSGSMMSTRTDGQSRCSYSKQEAIDKISRFFFNANLNGQLIEVRTFNSANNMQSVTGGFVDFVGAMTAMNNLDDEGCSGSTALAQAMCSAADDLRAQFSEEASNGARLRVYGSTDGDENSSPNTPCGGSNWQDEVRSKYTVEVPTVEFNPTIFTGTVSAAVRHLAVIEQDQGKTGAISTKSSTFEFLQELAVETGGEIELISDSDGDNPNEPWFDKGKQ
ncbi:VWA domain-containing protein [uncultured Shewanella sp.]|uniref:VWA domain-containing protein n=1 Tax=uncultured Shewanella sp. TaxID=173975 RepID=UPI00262D5AD5|nr:VWA domain-containing protein [uncultured Shewanella sp.]